MLALPLPGSGLRLTPKGIEAEETGALIPVDRDLLRNLRAWLPYGAAEFARTMNRENILEIDAVPSLPKPYYLLWGVLRRAGLRPGPNPALSVMFTDKTFPHEHPEVPPISESGGFVLNGSCTDISKSRVARVFEDVFGYPLAIDPTTHRGPAVEKGEGNGIHDGRIVSTPRAALPGRVYQRVIDNRVGDDRVDGGAFVEDLRCPTVFGEIGVVCAKRRPTRDRFANLNTSCELREPEDVFSALELTRITAFCQAMRLDWGGLDILRDRGDGRIYIVDVNKTDMPVLVLSTEEKLEVSDRLAKLLRAGVEARLETSAHTR